MRIFVFLCYVLLLLPLTACNKSDTAYADRLNNQAIALYNEGKYDQALPLFEQSIELREKLLGKEHADVAQSLNNLGELYRVQGQYDKALPLYESALAIYEKVRGKEHSSVAITLNNIGLLYQAQEEYAQAKPIFERALEIFKKNFAPQHPYVKTVSKNYEDLLSKVPQLIDSSGSAAETHQTTKSPTVANSTTAGAVVHSEKPLVKEQ